MTDTGKTLTTSEYSKMTGISVSTITHMLRQGRLSGEKRGGKWAIFPIEGQNAASPTGKTTPGSAKSTIGNEPPAKPGSDKTYDVKTFARMTYLTEKGVSQWFRLGRLSGRVDPGGNVLLDAANLERPDLRHLIR